VTDAKKAEAQAVPAPHPSPLSRSPGRGSIFRSSSRQIGYLFNTLRYLRPVQIYGRVWFHLYHPRSIVGPTPELRSRQALWCQPGRRKASMYGPVAFRFVNESHELNSDQDWNHPLRPKLWLYHLHYFDDLNAQDAKLREAWHRALIARWIRENPAPHGNGWEPYPLSLRIVNWIKWVLAGNTLDETALCSLAAQARYLSQRLEWHLLGNHLFANAKALAFAGLFFSGAEAAAWLDKGIRVLRREVETQVLPDGGHFERSPMYHSIILEDLLDLVNLARTYEAAWPDRQLACSWVAIAQRMRKWLVSCCHPDGQIALFNDAAFDVACAPKELNEYAKRLGLEPIFVSAQNIDHLEESGYVRLRQEPAFALLDVGEIGPDYIPGHAHADTLSFELSLFGERVLVDSGTSSYAAGSERLRQRSTSAHNTVVVNGENSSEVWSSFRVARRAKPFGLLLNDSKEALEVTCAHSGYRRLKGKPVHWREWVLQKSRLMVRDWIQGPFQEAESTYHFHPALVIDDNAVAQIGLALTPGGNSVSWEVVKGIATLQPTTYHPKFGVSEPNTSLRVRFTESETTVIFHW
jgi:hypothetical protein